MGVNARRRQLAPEPYSLGHLRVLFERLIDAQEGRGEGETTVVETLRAISEVVVFGENQDAKIAAKAAKAEEMRQSQKAEDSAPNGDAGTGGRVAENTPEAGGGAAAVVVEGATDIRRQDAFFELFCEKNMMSRFIELLRSPPSRYESSGDVSRSSMNSLGAPTWGTNGGLDALVRALTWGGDILGIGQQQQVPQQQGTSGSGGAGRGRLMAPEGGSARGSRERSSAEVQVQVIQTTSILVMNVKSDTSLFYLLSNNHVNDMIMFDFRLGDEEVLSHFASFLKTLSLRLNPNTVQFFLCSPRRRRHRDDPTGRAENSHSNGREEIRNDGDSEDRRNRGKGGGGGGTRGKTRGKTRGAEATGVRREENNKPKKAGSKQPQEHHLEEEEEATFPLYTKALEYICHSDFHVRIAALTVVLNIYKQRDPLVRAYLNGPAARSASLPDRLVGALRSQCLVLADRAMSAGMMGGASGKMAPAKGGAAMAVVDPGICRDSIAGLQDQVFYLEDVFSSGQGELNAQLCEALLSRLVRPMLLGDWLSGRPGAMFAQVALCALAQLFIVVTYPPLVRLLVLETLASEGDGSYPSLLALLQGDREELCLGALVVIQALAQNRVVRVDLGLAHDFDDDDDDDAGGISAFDRSETLGDEGVEASEACPAAPGEGNRCSRAGNIEMRPLGPEILGSTVDALCRMLVPGDFSSLSDAAAVAKAGPRRHHLVLRLCGKVLASLAPPPSTSPDQDFGNPNVNMNAHVNLRQSAATAATGALPTIDEQRRTGGMEEGDGRGNLALDDPEAKGSASFARREAAAASDGMALRKASGQRETVLRRIGEAHSAAAAMVLRGLGGAEGASCVVVFEEEIREWSKRTDLDGAITNLPKMSSLILRWSLDNTSLSQRHQSADDSQPPLGASQDARVEESEVMRRQRELRGSLQAFLEIRQVRRLLSGKGKIDPWVLRIAGLGPEAEEEPREGGSLDLGGRECLACSIPNPAPRLPAAAAGEDDRAGKVRKRRNGGAAALSVTAGAGRRGRSELYLVLDAKAFLLATPDRHRLSNGEVRSAAPLIHLAVAPDPADETRLHIRALSDRPVALMRPVTPPRLLKTTTSPGKPGAVSASGSQDKKAAASGTPRDGGVAAAGGGGAGSMCDKQAWACELVFENARSCRLARKHMEGRRLRLRSEKMKLITDLLEACVQGTDD